MTREELYNFLLKVMRGINGRIYRLKCDRHNSSLEITGYLLRCGCVIPEDTDQGRREES
ncbi:MAG: hypothetical protein NZ920_01315 [Aigarchaeota archaeon]|nr:hypothetical protein [Aigarchaeota archaeon]MDW8093081.1 hypothetical protein [Nitrososphaerota archaeon]